MLFTTRLLVIVLAFRISRIFAASPKFNLLRLHRSLLFIRHIVMLQASPVKTLLGVVFFTLDTGSEI